jgi:hypothetical protein
MAEPVAKADIPLDDDTRKRIAQDLGLDESQLDAVPKRLSIARYSDDEVGDDVSGFLFNTLQPQIKPTGPISGGGAGGISSQLQVGKIPGGLLVPL